MTYFDCTLPTPAGNIACDQALLDIAEEDQKGETLRLWESDVPFVVLGFSRSIEADVKIPYCRSHGIPIIRRCTGGGTVVQGPGCLNYTLVLRTDRSPHFNTITSTNKYVMGRIRNAIASVLPDEPIAVAGDTDLVLSGMKFSGNAQRRGSGFVLFHGTFLLDFDITIMHKLLKIPDKQPAYREGRRHESFVRNLLINGERVREALMREWEVSEAKEVQHNGGECILPDRVMKRMEVLVEERYANDAWNRKR